MSSQYTISTAHVQSIHCQNTISPNISRYYPVHKAHVQSVPNLSSQCPVFLYSHCPVRIPPLLPMFNHNTTLCFPCPVNTPSLLSMSSQYTISTSYPAYLQLVHHIKSIYHLHCLCSVSCNGFFF